MKKLSIKKLTDMERRRIQEKLATTEPGTEEYQKLLKAREQLEDIESKRRDGKVKSVDVWKAFLAIGSTIGIVLADFWIPAIGNKLRLQDFVKRLFK